MIMVKRNFKSLQDQMNNLTSEKRTKREFLELLNRIESELCMSYDANFRIKHEEIDNILNCEILLNDFVLLTFRADF